MTFDLAHIWAHMSLLSKAIAAGLFVMAIASVGVVVERVIAFSKAQAATDSFVGKARLALESWHLEQIADIAKAHKGSPLAQLFDRMTKKYLEAQASKGSLSATEQARNEASRQLEVVGSDLRRGMNILASVGSVAPFVGLLGTVVGIIAAFQGIASTGSGGLGAVSAGISEALIETAFGLMVAIPAVLFYNYLTARVAAIELSLNGSVGELLDEMENNHGREPQKRVEKAA